MKKIAVIGGGGFGREVKMLLDQMAEKTPQYEFIGFYDDGIPAGTMVNGFPVLGGLDDLTKAAPVCLALAIGNPLTKAKILQRLEGTEHTFPTLIHPSVFIGKDDVEIGAGTIICAGCILTVNINIGKYVILNLGCTVGHDTRIGDRASFMPSVNISGEVEIAEDVYVGTGAKIINQLEIGAGSVIGAGAVVSKSIPAHCTAVGIPAKPIKFHTSTL